jgi:predicted acetyltransferase
MNVRKIELRSPSLSLVASYLDFVEAMRQQGDKVWDGILPKPDEPPDRFVERLLEAETAPEPGLVPETTYWATLGEEVVGRIALRHELNAALSEFGGHIGYEVHPAFRRQTIATEMLKRVLATPKAKEIGRLLLTCAPDNVGSNKTIRANGGVLAKTAFVEKWQRSTNDCGFGLHRQR